MIGVKISDGLGNQLFQYATAYSLAKHKNCGLILDHSILDTNPIRKYELNQFKLICDRVIGIDHFPSKPLKVLARFFIQKTFFSSYDVIFEKEKYSFDNSIFNKKAENIYLNGYWQDYRYFNNYRKELGEMLIPLTKMSSYANDLVNKVNSIPNSVAVHLRRGDYVGKADLPLSYYHEAFECIKKRINNPVFIFFSDDPNYVSKEFGDQENSIIVNNRSDNQSIEDFYLMKICENHIIANSTYSWWAAYGSLKGVTICPIYRSWKKSFYPEEWIKINS